MKPLYIIVLFCQFLTTGAERQLFCSSESISVWYSYDGPLYHLSVTGSPCSLGMTTYNIIYTVIPMFSIARIGFEVAVLYKGQLWLAHSQPNVPCEDLKICYIIKGETLYDSLPVYVSAFYPPEGEYQIYLNMTFVDDLENVLTARFNITVLVKRAAYGRKHFRLL